ncbi:MAG: putative bifunctional diguanylate cyclase/phosphodiesterase [Oscillospiraceae bacterium]
MSKNKELNHNISEKNSDSLTGLITYNDFCDVVSKLIIADKQGVENGEYAFVYFDILRFKVINDIFGTEEGDKFLVFMAERISEACGEDGIACRISSDRFAMFTHKNGSEIETALQNYLDAVAAYPLSYEIVSNIGIYITESSEMSVASMLDRAILAHSLIKGNYINKYNYYNSSQRDAILGEQEIAGMMNAALEEKHFVVYYQPQYNHVDGSLVGAEALVRWNHPKRGLIPPGKFIPIFEKNGFITKVDIYVFETVCAFIRKSLDTGKNIIPISVNISRRDIYHPNLVETLESIRKKYNVPVDMIRIEVTESALVDGVQRISEFIDAMHEIGYIVEMDDFGSAYSSLNSLKNIDLDILKLDMKFLSDDGDRNQSAIILSSVVKMAKWLGFSIIAEGVEHIEQADYLRSIGCCYMQGYLYAKPMPEDEFIDKLQNNRKCEIKPAMKLTRAMNSGDFWNAESLDTMIFNNFVGGAAIFEYKKKGSIDLMRINKKYIQEIGGNCNEENIWNRNLRSAFDDENYNIYIDMLQRAIKSGNEEECETWRNYTGNEGDEVCIRASVRLIGESIDSYFFYDMIRNITSEKRAMEELMHREKIFRAASEQLNVYYWEYIVDTKEMYPCFRCMRDLHFPAVMENYPEPAIEMGVFPPEVADKYRDVMKRVENGETNIEVDMPLTEDRVMFRIRYTTELDENGKAVKAYGSAAII